jgi:hypothetical protein
VVLAVSATLLCISSIVYLVIVSQFTFTEPLTKLRDVKGFVCTSDALIVYRDLCPWLHDDQLMGAEWDASRLWTLWSITVVRVLLVTFWALSFTSLSSLIGSFVVYQSSGTTNGTRSESTSKRRSVRLHE